MSYGIYARDVHSGAGNCVCGWPLDASRHTEAAPGVPIPGRAVNTTPEEANAPEPHRCPSCGEPTVYQSFSGGREFYCAACDNHGMYEQGEAPRRAQMLADGRVDELRTEMRQEIARRKDDHHDR